MIECDAKGNVLDLSPRTVVKPDGVTKKVIVPGADVSGLSLEDRISACQKDEEIDAIGLANDVKFADGLNLDEKKAAMLAALPEIRAAAEKGAKAKVERAQKKAAAAAAKVKAGKGAKKAKK